MSMLRAQAADVLQASVGRSSRVRGTAHILQQQDGASLREEVLYANSHHLPVEGKSHRKHTESCKFQTCAMATCW